MADFAQLGISVDSRPVLDGAKALDTLGEAAVRVEQKTGAMNGQMNDTAVIMRKNAEATNSASDAAKAFLEPLQREVALFGASRAEILRYDAAKAGLSATTQKQAAALGAAIDAMKRDEQAAQAVSKAQDDATRSADAFVRKLQDQAAVLGMSRSQLATYQAAQMGVTAQTEQAIARIREHEQAVRANSQAQADSVKTSNMMVDALKLLAAGYAALKLKDLITDAAMLNARYEELGVVMRVVGNNAGYSNKEMEGYAAAVQKQGISMLESRQSIIKLAQAHIDLSHASELARGAQDAAVIGGINSSEAFDRMVNGIARGNVLILRNLGINVNLQNAYKDMADSLGITTKELSENERVEARRIAVTERLVDINGVYTASMDTAAKQIRSTTRYIEDLKVVQGEIFNEALTIAVMAFTGALKDAGAASVDLKANGSLKEWGESLTSTLAFAADAVMSVAAGFRWAGTSYGAFWALVTAGNQAGRDAVRAAYAIEAQGIADSTSMFRDATTKRRADIAAVAAERLDAEKNYAKNQLAVQKAYADQSVEIQRKAQFDLAAASGQSTKPYLGRISGDDHREVDVKPKVDQVESTKLADALARIQDEVNAQKQMYDTMSKMDDMFHAAGKMGDEVYYQNKRDLAAAEAKDQIAGYDQQIADLKAYHNATAAEAEKHAKQINDIAAKRRMAARKAEDEENLLNAKEFLRKDAILAASDDANNKYISDLNKQAAAIELANGKHQKAASAISEEAAAQLRLAAAAMAVQAAAPVDGDHDQASVDAAKAMLVTLLLQAEAQERISKAMRDGEAAAFMTKQADQAIQDWQRAGQSIGESLTSAFGSGGKALGGMFKAYAEGMAGQLRAQKALNEAKKLADDNPEKALAIDRAHLDNTQAQIKSYGDMAGAAQGFFAEGSKGYAAMSGAAKVLQTAEVALSLVKGVNAVLTQGEGDPYSAFARMAAMAAIVVGLGVAISGGGGGGGKSAADVQKAQGTGTVFGDSQAKSDSIKRSIDLMSANTSDLIPINQGMLSALQSIDASMSGLTNLIVRVPGLTDGTNMGIKEGAVPLGGAMGSIASEIKNTTWLGQIAGGLVDALFGKVSQSIVDSGLQFGGSVRDLEQGKGVNQYASVDTTKSSWFGLSKSTSNSVTTQGVGTELSSQFGLIFTNLETALKGAATGLGIDAAAVTKTLDSLSIPVTSLSLKGLTGDALTSAINGVVSAAMDTMTAAVFPTFDKFRKVGEGYTETVMRLVSDYSTLDASLTSIGMSFGAVGIDSIAARESLIALSGGLDALTKNTSGFASNFLTKAEQLAPVQKYVTDQLTAMGMAGVTTRDQFKAVVLGLNLTTDAGQAQYAAMMSLQGAFAAVTPAIKDLSKSAQEVADERKAIQDRIDELTMTSIQLLQKQKDQLDLSNQGLFDYEQSLIAANQATAEAKTAADAAAADAKTKADAQAASDLAIAKAQRGLDIQLMTAMGDAEGALAATRSDALAALLSDQARTTQAQIWAADAATAAIAKAQAAATASASAAAALQAAAATQQAAADAGLRSFGDALVSTMNRATDAAKALRDLNSALLIGDSSTLNPEAKYAEAKRQFDTAGPDGLQAAETAFLAASKAWFGGSAGYAADFASVINRNAAEASVQDALPAAIVNFWRDFQKSSSIDGSHAGGLDVVPFDNYRANLHKGERVQTAAAVKNGDAAAQRTNDLLVEVLTELRADKAQRGGVAVATIDKLDKLVDKADATRRQLARA